MKRIIFIDIDGPLAWGTFFDGRVIINENNYDKFTIPYPLVKEDCDALNEICEKANAELVLSSDWRKHYTLKQMNDVFSHYGINHRIIDITTHQSLWTKFSSPSLDWTRASQVVKWAKDNKISNWIAIDDLYLSDQFKWMKPRIPMWRHIQVDGDFGTGGRLRDKIDECIKKLKK